MIEFNRLSDARRLEFISQRIGFALWQLQELEGIAATYLVLTARATRGMGEVAGNALLEDALSKPFGRTVRDLKKAGTLPATLEDPTSRLLTERNWLVHRSRASSRSAVRREDHCVALVSRIEAIGEEALALMRQFGTLVEEFAKSNGVTSETIEVESVAILKRWHGGDAT